MQSSAPADALHFPAIVIYESHYLETHRFPQDFLTVKIKPNQIKSKKVYVLIIAHRALLLLGCWQHWQLPCLLSLCYNAESMSWLRGFSSDDWNHLLLGPLRALTGPQLRLCCSWLKPKQQLRFLIKIVMMWTKMLFNLQDCLPQKQNKLKKIATVNRLKTHLISLNQTGGVNSVSIRLLLSESCVIWTVN